MDPTFQSLLAVLEVVWINIVLSGDNAVVIALACRGLPLKQRRMGLVLGAGVAVLLRVIFTLVVVQLLALPFLRIGGSLLLVWIAIQLLTEDEAAQEDKIASSDKLIYAVRTVAIADMVMSLDNVLAIAAVAKDNTFLLMLGLLISVPLIVAGATLIMALLSRFPLLVWAGAGLLGWVAGEMLDSDPFLIERFGEEFMQSLELPLAAAFAAIVLVVGYMLRRRSHAAA
jgi:YjbE family integral membrane protein